MSRRRIRIAASLVFAAVAGLAIAQSRPEPADFRLRVTIGPNQIHVACERGCEFTELRHDCGSTPCAAVIDANGVAGMLAAD